MCLKRERARNDTRTWDLAGSPLGPSFPQTRIDSFQSSIRHWSSFFSVAYLSPDRSTRRRPRDFSDPFVRIATRSNKPCLTSRTSDLTKAFFQTFATLFRQPLSGTSLVYLKFSTRGIQHQVYLPNIQHPSTEISEHKGALSLFF